MGFQNSGVIAHRLRRGIAAAGPKNPRYVGGSVDGVRTAVKQQQTARTDGGGRFRFGFVVNNRAVFPEGGDGLKRSAAVTLFLAPQLFEQTAQIRFIETLSGLNRFQQPPPET